LKKLKNRYIAIQALDSYINIYIISKRAIMSSQDTLNLTEIEEDTNTIVETVVTTVEGDETKVETETDPTLLHSTTVTSSMSFLEAARINLSEDDSQSTSTQVSDTPLEYPTVDNHSDTTIDDTTTTTRPSWNGKRPFEGGIEEYNTIMYRRLDGAVRKLEDNSHFTYAPVRLNPKELLTVTLDDGNERNYKIHEVHYGPLNTRSGNVHWHNRDNIWEQLESYPPFRTLQVEYLQKGYYLREESGYDPDDNRVVIRLYRDCPVSPLYLWHSYGVIPTLGPVHPQVQYTSSGTIPTMEQLSVLFPGITFPEGFDLQQVIDSFTSSATTSVAER
jgi:hypothetical protein